MASARGATREIERLNELIQGTMPRSAYLYRRSQKVCGGAYAVENVQRLDSGAWRGAASLPSFDDEQTWDERDEYRGKS